VLDPSLRWDDGILWAVNLFLHSRFSRIAFLGFAKWKFNQDARSMHDAAQTNTIKLQHWRASQAEKPLEDAPVLEFQSSFDGELSRTPKLQNLSPWLHTQSKEAEIDSSGNNVPHSVFCFK
jgi:hypothetical protein